MLTAKSSDDNALEKRGYQLGKKLGQGSYAKVRLAEFKNGDKTEKLACKIIDKTTAPKDFLNKFFPRELEIITKVEHPNVIRVHSILERSSRVFIFMQCAEHGDLLEYIQRHGALQEQRARVWFQQLVSGVQYMHGLDICHRDLKCENILITKHNNIKIADLGFARYCADADGRRALSETYCGSAAYAAPEVVRGTPYNPKLSDVWSQGVILYIMVNASMPFDDSNLNKMLKDQLSRNWTFRSKVKDRLSPQIKNMIERILEPDINRRITIDTILSHEWLSTSASKTE